VKRFIAVLSGLLVLPAFAEVAPAYYDEIVEYTDDMLNESDIIDEEFVAESSEQQQKPNVVQRQVAGRSVSRVTSAGGNSSNSRVNTNTRAVASSPRNAQQTTRGTVSRTTKTQGKTGATKTNVVSRSRTNVTSRSATGATRTSTKSKPVVARVSATGDVIPGIRNTNSTTAKTLTDSGEPLYISARVGTGNRRSGSRNASLTATSTTPVITDEDISSTTSTLTNLAELTEYCKAQYAQCMDNYCNVLDENQGRCSCSANIKTYEKTEQSLATITENFQDVVQKIKYIGLTTAQIEALFAETEAEIAMKSNTDSSQLKNSLDAIKKKIVDVSAGKTTNSLTDGLSFDMSGLLDTDFSATFDLNSFLGTSNNVSSQRGTTLFNTATQRCKTAVLNSCVTQGIDAKVITNSYDLAIDKKCVEYERSLNEANTEMRNNVRNAQTILQQARLLLAQKKNAYDLRGCVAALDECMQDEYVCGDEYELCLDPTGKYLAKGEIVKGGTPGIAGGSVRNQTPLQQGTMLKWVSDGMYGLYSVWDYGDNCKTENKKGCTNAWGGNTENLNEYIASKMNTWSKNYEYKKWGTLEQNDIATYLLRRVGYIDTKEDKSYGMCADVMKQCQDYTFDTGKSNKKFLPDNEVVRQYLALALGKIKSKQDEILSDYAESCWNDVYSCLSTNNYDDAYIQSMVSRTAVNACRGEIATCMSVTGYHPSDNDTLTLAVMTEWVGSKLLSCDSNYYLEYKASSDTGSPATFSMNNVKCTACPMATNSTTNTNIGQTTSSGGQATMCECPAGYTTTDTQPQSGTTYFEYTDNKKHYCVNDGSGQASPAISNDACGYAVLDPYTINVDIKNIMESTTEVRKLGVTSLEWISGSTFKTSWQAVVGEYMYVIPLKFSDEQGRCMCPEKIENYDIKSLYSDTSLGFASFVSDTFDPSISQHILCLIQNES